MEAFYRDLHAHPELSGQEVRTAKKLATELRSLGYVVTENVGGTGVVAVLDNGKGPVAWIRADMDGLPVEEGTGVGYSSEVDGVMHACGHDVHVAAMTGYAHALSELRDQWRGTVVLIGQPAEETVTGAKAMIADGLFRRFPKPDYVLAFHVKSSLTAGHVAYKEGYTHASIDSVDIEVRGKGGHGAAPHRTVDPIVLASKMVLNAQTLISRAVDPMDPVVLSFGSVHGGTKHNIIPKSVHLQGTMRAYSPDVRAKMKQGIVRMANALAEADGAPKPTVTYSESTPALFNDVKLTARLVPIFEQTVGAKRVSRSARAMYSEDFTRYSRDGKIPVAMFFVGGKPKRPPKGYGHHHSGGFAPDYKTALDVAVRAMTNAVIELQKRPLR
ncbi:MAG: amidohydrolase [Myxococcota bacterium]